MAGSVNKTILVGNLVRDPEVRTTQDGTKIVNITVATSDTWNDKQTGERKERSEYHRVVIFNDRAAKVAEEYLEKGRRVYVEGALQTREFTDQSGQKRYMTEVVIGKFKGELVLLDSAGNRDEEPRQERRPATRRGQEQSGQSREAQSSWDDIPRRGGGDLNDEIPFSVPWR